MKLWIVLLIGVLLVASFSFLSDKITFDKSESKVSLIYEGPVPQGYDLKHFRETGETIKESLENG